MVKEAKKTLVLRNKTFTYLLPMLGESAKDFKNCSAAFVGNIDKPKLKNKIHLLFRMNKDWSTDLHTWLLNLETYDTHYSVEEDYVMYVYDLPEENRRNYFLFLEGKYSLLDDDYKRHIIFFHNNASEAFLNKLKQILYKDEQLYLELERSLDTYIPRTQEISSIPDLDVEVFNKTILK